MNKIMRTGMMALWVVSFAGCNQVGQNVKEPPRPTIVQVTPTLTSQPQVATSTPIPPTFTPTSEAISQGDTLQPTATIVQVEKTTPAPTAVIEPTFTPTPTPVQRPALDALNINLVPVADGFDKPLYLTHAGDGSNRLFVVEQPGRILTIENDGVRSEPFLDIVSIVGSDANEQGLLSVAFHPNYSENGHFFVNYTNKQGDTVIARYSVSDNPNVANPHSAKILMTIGQPYGNHNGGHILFGPDGYLYIGMGDGGAANDPQNRAQDLTTLLGKILRIDVDNADPYGVPPTNPFVNNETARPEIWSYGWRNPWRMSFDKETNDFYIGDVGQNQYEEIHVEWANDAGGKNYGWRLMEGAHCFNPSDCSTSGLELPVAEYDHSEGCSVTGGYVYRGRQFPALDGIYFFGDYCSGNIWGLRHEPDGSWSQAELMQSDKTISSFGQDWAGELYLIDHKGAVWQLTN